MVRIVVAVFSRAADRSSPVYMPEKLSRGWKRTGDRREQAGYRGHRKGSSQGATDGTTIMLTSNGHTVIGAMNRTLNFDPLNDFVGVRTQRYVDAVDPGGSARWGPLNR